MAEIGQELGYPDPKPGALGVVRHTQTEMVHHLAKLNMGRSNRKGPWTSFRVETKIQPLRGLKLSSFKYWCGKMITFAFSSVYVYMHIWKANINTKAKYKLKSNIGTSLVEEWLRIHLPMQGTRVRALVREDPTCYKATKPVCHNYWARVLQLLKPLRLEPVLHNKRSHRKEKPAHHKEE